MDIVTELGGVLPAAQDAKVAGWVKIVTNLVFMEKPKVDYVFAMDVIQGVDVNLSVQVAVNVSKENVTAIGCLVMHMLVLSASFLAVRVKMASAAVTDFVI